MLTAYCPRGYHHVQCMYCNAAVPLMVRTPAALPWRSTHLELQNYRTYCDGPTLNCLARYILPPHNPPHPVIADRESVPGMIFSSSLLFFTHLFSFIVLLAKITPSAAQLVLIPRLGYPTLL